MTEDEAMGILAVNVARGLEVSLVVDVSLKDKIPDYLPDVPEYLKGIALEFEDGTRAYSLVDLYKILNPGDVNLSHCARTILRWLTNGDTVYKLGIDIEMMSQAILNVYYKLRTRRIELLELPNKPGVPIRDFIVPDRVVDAIIIRYKSPIAAAYADIILGRYDYEGFRRLDVSARMVKTVDINNEAVSEYQGLSMVRPKGYVTMREIAMQLSVAVDFSTVQYLGYIAKKKAVEEGIDIVKVSSVGKSIVPANAYPEEFAYKVLKDVMF